MIDLIPMSYLNEVCFLSLNTDDKKYRMCLKMAQDDIKITLGTDFYTELETQYTANTFTAANQKVYDVLQDVLAWKTYFNYLKFANVDATPTGIRVFDDENSTLAGDVQMYSLEKNVRTRAQQYEGTMIGIMKAKPTDYPLWKSCSKGNFGFAITSVAKESRVSKIISIDRAIDTNE